MGILKNKRALIIGLASKRSIAYGIAEAFHREGAEIALTYQNDKLKRRVEKMAAEWDSNLTFPCDVSSDEQISDLFTQLKEHWDSFDILIHSVAFAPGALLEGDYLDNLTRDGFQIAHDISSYSFAALAKEAKPMMLERKGALLTLSYLGAERVVHNYNVMGVAKASLEANVRYMASSLGQDGIRVNAISAGPIRTLAASGIKDFRKMLDFNERATPLKQNVTIEQVGNTAAFLCSDWGSGITAEVLHVDGGFHSIAMIAPQALQTEEEETA